MTFFGVGSVVALTYAPLSTCRLASETKAVGAVFGLTPSSINRARSTERAISKCGDEMMRVMLYEASRAC